MTSHHERSNLCLTLTWTIPRQSLLTEWYCPSYCSSTESIWYTGRSCHKYNFCHDKFFCKKRWTYACHDKTSDATKLCLSQLNICHDQHNCVITNFCCCGKNNFVMAKVLSWHAYFCHNKRRVLSWQTCFVTTNIFVATKLLLQENWYLWQLPPMIFETLLSKTLSTTQVNRLATAQRQILHRSGDTLTRTKGLHGDMQGVYEWFRTDLETH